MLMFDETVLDAAAERRLAQEIEVGVLAAEALASGEFPPGASLAELKALTDAGEAARERFVAANLRLVAFVVNPLAARSGLDRDELFQEGVLGLLEALRRYDHTRGARFATFALPWIRMKTSEWALTRCGTLGIPASRARSRVQVRAVQNLLTASLGRMPTIEEVAAHSGRSVAGAQALLDYLPPGPLTDLDLVADDPEVAVLDEMGIRRLLRMLPDGERRVIDRLYGLAAHPVHSYAEVALALRMSVSTVRRRERAALRRLRGSEALVDAA